MPAQTARKLNISGAYSCFAPIVNKEVHLHRSLNNGCIWRVQRVHRYRVMIACCNDGTRPVIFKIERIDIVD